MLFEEFFTIARMAGNPFEAVSFCNITGVLFRQLKPLPFK